MEGECATSCAVFTRKLEGLHDALLKYVPGRALGERDARSCGDRAGAAWHPCLGWTTLVSFAFVDRAAQRSTGSETKDRD